jgi:hypothetical protein
MTATQDQLDEYCSTVLQPLAESLMKSAEESGYPAMAFYQACMHHTLYALKHILEETRRQDLPSTINVLASIAKQMAEEELEGK